MLWFGWDDLCGAAVHQPGDESDDPDALRDGRGASDADALQLRPSAALLHPDGQGFGRSDIGTRPHHRR